MSFYDDIDLVYNSKINTYFREVINSYDNMNYRSAIVMLYSVVICDLLYKMIDLRDIYGDTVAADILKEVEKSRANPDQLSAWENRLVEEIHSRTVLLDNDVYTNIMHLKNHRNFSAHPALNSEYELYVPNRETVASHIRNMLDGVLKKPPVFAKKITQMLSEDLKQKKEVFKNNDEEFRTYLDSRYFNHMPESMFNAVFKDFWKFIYVLDNEETRACLMINHWTLMHMLKTKGALITESIGKNCKILQIVITDNTKFLVALCTSYPPFYNVLPAETRQAITSICEQERILKLVSIFSSKNTKTQIEKMISEIKASPEDWQLDFGKSIPGVLRKWLLDEGRIDVYIDLIITLIENCLSFDVADNYFNYLVKAYLDDFTNNDFMRLINVICNNKQLNQRERSYEDNSKIASFITKKFGEGSIDFNKYPAFKYGNLVENIDSPFSEEPTAKNKILQKV